MASFGFTLINRGPVVGALKASDLIEMAVEAEASAVFDTVWVGDSILAKPRLEALAMLGVVAGATSKVRLATGCLSTFVHRHPVLFAQQWASLDVLSNGRMWLFVCLGGSDEQSRSQVLEHAVLGVKSKERVERLEEGIAILRKLFEKEDVNHSGRFYQFAGVTMRPTPVQNPCPIGIASNPTSITWKNGASAPDHIVERNFRRAARLADAWMTNKASPDQFRDHWTRIKGFAREEGRDPDQLGNVYRHSININADRQAALEESKAFLEKYYDTKFSAELVERRSASGSPQECIEQLKAYFDAGVQHISLRFTSWDQRGQLQRFVNEVAPAFL